MRPPDRGRQPTMFPIPRWWRCYRKKCSPVIDSHPRPLTNGPRAPGRVPSVALHATTIRFADRAYLAIARAADSQGVSVSQYVREAALIRAVLDELDSAEEALHTAHDLLAIAREVRRLAEVDPPGPPRANAGRTRSGSANLRQDG
jgi:hypothetical protein